MPVKLKQELLSFSDASCFFAVFFHGNIFAS